MTYSTIAPTKLSFATILLLVGFLSGCSSGEDTVENPAPPAAAASEPAGANPPPSSPQPTTPQPATPTPPTPAAVTVVVAPAVASLSTLQMQQFTATVQNTTNPAVTWQVDGVRNGNASVGTISATGLYKPPSVAGTHAITAISVADSTKSGSASANVSLATSPPPITVTVTPPTASISTAQTQQFTALVANTSNTAVTWQVDAVAGGNATVGRISADGLYSPPSSAGAHTITAISAADSTKRSSASVTVTAASSTVVVSVAPTTAVISTLQSQAFTATVEGSSNQSVTWLVDGVPGGNADVGTITVAGLYVPSRVEASRTIAAVSVADPTKRSSVTVRVTLLNGVLTYHNDNARTGQTLQESILTPANVKAATFGRLFTLPVDGDVYAQPLYVTNVPISGKLYNILIVATEHDSVYAFDAEKGGAALWHKSFLDPANGITSVPSTDVDCDEIAPEVGITSTPVIDPATGLLYVVAKTKERGVAKYRLHSLDITTGADKSAGGMEIQASVPGTALPNDGRGNVVFTPTLENQRLALLLSKNTIYFGTSSYCDFGDHHGWMFAYDAKTLALRSAFSTTPNGDEGGIWQSGGGAAADANGNVYAITGDGAFDAAKSNYGNTILKFDSNSLAVTDYFTPFNQETLDAVNADLSAGGLVLLPDQPAGPPRLLVGGGKQGIIYVLDRDNMGKFQAGSDSQIVQSFPSGTCGAGSCALFGVPAYFNNTVYTVAVNDGLKSYSIAAGRLSLSGRSANTYRWPGATPAISANGANNGIVWTVERNGASGSAILRAHSAANVTTELYNSNEQPLRDAPGQAIKFVVPTISNGKVFVGTRGQVSVFGLLN